MATGQKELKTAETQLAEAIADEEFEENTDGSIANQRSWAEFEWIPPAEFPNQTAPATNFKHTYSRSASSWVATIDDWCSMGMATIEVSFGQSGYYYTVARMCELAAAAPTLANVVETVEPVPAGTLPNGKIIVQVEVGATAGVSAGCDMNMVPTVVTARAKAKAVSISIVPQ